MALVYNSPSNFSVSILENSNRVVSSSSDNFGGLREGSYIKIGDDNILYSISKIKRFFYLKDFEIINTRTLKINSSTGIDLQNNDTIKIIYDEYELNSIINIFNKGKFYKEGEIIIIKGGELSTDLASGINYPTRLEIEGIDEDGGITRLGLKEKGKYVVFPPIKSEVNGTGENAILETKYSIIENRSIIERVIKKLDIKDSETIIELDYSLPIGLKTGKLSVEKWEMFLDKNYNRDTVYNIDYKIFKDFTPICQLPLLLNNSTSFFIIFNQAMQKLDSEINSLKNQIKELKDKK